MIRWSRLSELISISTRCASLEQFVALFHRYIDPEDHALFIASRDPREVGATGPFQIKLRDGSVVVRGDAEVVRTWKTESEGCPWGRPGYCIRVTSVAAESKSVYALLLASARTVPALARRTAPPPERTPPPEIFVPPPEPRDAPPDPEPSPLAPDPTAARWDLIAVALAAIFFAAAIVAVRFLGQHG